jgi:hypothetical protein
MGSNGFTLPCIEKILNLWDAMFDASPAEIQRGKPARRSHGHMMQAEKGYWASLSKTAGDKVEKRIGEAEFR